MTDGAIRHLFVYGTLRPGDVRWHLLAPFVVDDGCLDTVSGRLFDTGFDYPAASFDAGGTIHGQSFALLETSLTQALELLDEVEGVVEGEYVRIAVRTGRGIDAWAYAGGSSLDLTPIPSGDWFEHRPP
jgi:gamma-glutamylcyclotransferase (GGCT)/AIG2-like uncharacterized protein YtfP